MYDIPFSSLQKRAADFVAEQRREHAGWVQEAEDMLKQETAPSPPDSRESSTK